MLPVAQVWCTTDAWRAACLDRQGGGELLCTLLDNGVIDGPASRVARQGSAVSGAMPASQGMGSMAGSLPPGGPGFEGRSGPSAPNMSDDGRSDWRGGGNNDKRFIVATGLGAFRLKGMQEEVEVMHCRCVEGVGQWGAGVGWVLAMQHSRRGAGKGGGRRGDQMTILQRVLGPNVGTHICRKVVHQHIRVACATRPGVAPPASYLLPERSNLPKHVDSTTYTLPQCHLAFPRFLDDLMPSLPSSTPSLAPGSFTFTHRGRSSLSMMGPQNNLRTNTLGTTGTRSAVSRGSSFMLMTNQQPNHPGAHLYPGPNGGPNTVPGLMTQNGALNMAMIGRYRGSNGSTQDASGRLRSTDDVDGRGSQVPYNYMLYNSSSGAGRMRGSTGGTSDGGEPYSSNGVNQSCAVQDALLPPQPPQTQPGSNGQGQQHAGQ